MDTPPIKLAFVIDNEVADVLYTDERLAAIFLSNPIIIDVTDKINENQYSVRIGMSYDQNTAEFLDPQPDQEQ
jgi:hypothetical protein